MTAPVQAEAWRLKLLILDEHPDRLANMYLAWARSGATVDIETSVEHALQRMQLGRYGLVLVPVTGAGALAGSEWFIGDTLERWVAANAPNYAGRLVFYGPPGAVDAALPEQRLRRSLTLLTIPFAPTPRDVERSLEQLSVAIRAAAARRRNADAASEAEPAGTAP